MSRQDPQVAPQPVRIVSSDTLTTPLCAASRIWWSVTPLQMQTYTCGLGRQARIGLLLFQWKREWLSISNLNHSRYGSEPPEIAQTAPGSPLALLRGQYPPPRLGVVRLRGRS